MVHLQLQEQQFPFSRAQLGLCAYGYHGNSLFLPPPPPLSPEIKASRLKGWQPAMTRGPQLPQNLYTDYRISPDCTPQICKIYKFGTFFCISEQSWSQIESCSPIFSFNSATISTSSSGTSRNSYTGFQELWPPRSHVFHTTQDPQTSWTTISSKD